MTDRSRTQDGQVSAAGAPELGHPWLSWSWSSALRGLTYALPAGLLVPLDVGNGLAVAVGVIPAAVMPLAPRRAQRFSVVVLGALMGLSILVGSALATVPWLAVVGLFALSVAAALAAASRRDGVLALTLCLPLVAIGFSYDGLKTLAGVAVAYFFGLLVPQFQRMRQPLA